MTDTWIIRTAPRHRTGALCDWCGAYVNKYDPYTSCYVYNGETKTKLVLHHDCFRALRSPVMHRDSVLCQAAHCGCWKPRLMPRGNTIGYDNEPTTKKDPGGIRKPKPTTRAPISVRPLVSSIFAQLIPAWTGVGLPASTADADKVDQLLAELERTEPQWFDDPNANAHVVAFAANRIAERLLCLK